MFRLGRFGLSGAFSFLLVLGITAGLGGGLGVSPRRAFAVALVAGFALNFIVVRRFVFRSRTPGWRRQMILYAAGSVGFRLGEYLLFLLLFSLLELPYLLAATLSLAVSFFGKFGFFGAVVFPESREERAGG